MTLQQLKYVVTIAEKGSISEAAKTLFVSQPSLTNSIKELEKEVKITIFNRNNKGIEVSNEGDIFLGYARQVIEQTDLLEEKYITGKEQRIRFSVSTQHYSFAVNAFVDVINEFDCDKYDFTLRETQTNEIIQDVTKMKSEIGVLYTSEKNQEVLTKLIKQNQLVFTSLYIAKPHVFISSNHPLAVKSIIKMEDLENYPYLSFEQGDYNSFYFSEEILSSLDHNKNIKVRDRATLFNLVIGLNGYTVSSGVISKELNGEQIVARPLDVNEHMNIGVITRKNIKMSRFGMAYLDALKKHIL